jgi:SEC-C motif-containing protein
MSARRTASLPCPCQSGLSYETCCGPAHDGSRPPATAEALMRSRYSAYALRLADWLVDSAHPSTRPASIDPAELAAAKWIGLQILRHEQRDAGHAIVEFVARCRVGGRATRLHETSRFIREDGHWYYVDGDVHED